MVPIIWSSIAPCNKIFADNNIPLQDISRSVQVIFVHDDSETITEDLYDRYGMLLNLSGHTELWQKGNLLFQFLRNVTTSWDILIRTDLDCVIFNWEALLYMIKWHDMKYGGYFVLGNGSIGKNEDHVRGACLITTRRAIQVLPPLTSDSPKKFDEPFIQAVREAGIPIIKNDLFEYGEVYSKKLPAWHPTRLRGAGRLELFNKVIKENYNAGIL